MLLKILTATKYLARQGLPFRGHVDQESNFFQLLNLMACGSPDLDQWLQRHKSFTSPAIQNELINGMGNDLLRQVSSNIRINEKYAIIADETTDAMNKTQLCLAIRHVDDNFQVSSNL
jgi:hypothetical protein